MPDSSSSASTFHYPKPCPPAPTEIACDISHIEQPPEEPLETLRAADIKVQDFMHESTPNSSKATELFNPVPCLIAADWHMRNPDKNHCLLSPKALSRLIKMDWLTLEDASSIRTITSPSRIITTDQTSGKCSFVRRVSEPGITYPVAARALTSAGGAYCVSG